jgi:hypothetical protein
MRLFIGFLALLTLVPALVIANPSPQAPNGISIPAGYRGWQLVAPSQRPDKGQIRVILGNDIALRALRDHIRPFPDGAILAKVAWTTRTNRAFPVAVEPDTFVQVEFMVKDSRKYTDTAGWGFARFLGSELTPYGKDPSFVKECFGCHQPVKGNDFVFTSLPPTP